MNERTLPIVYRETEFSLDQLLLKYDHVAAPPQKVAVVNERDL